MVLDYLDSRLMSDSALYIKVIPFTSRALKQFYVNNDLQQQASTIYNYRLNSIAFCNVLSRSISRTYVEGIIHARVSYSMLE